MYPQPGDHCSDDCNSSFDFLCSHFLSCCDTRCALCLAFPGYSLSWYPFPAPFKNFPTDQLVGFKFLNRIEWCPKWACLHPHYVHLPGHSVYPSVCCCTHQAGQVHPFALLGFHMPLLKSPCHTLAWAHRRKQPFTMYKIYIFYTRLHLPIPEKNFVSC